MAEQLTVHQALSKVMGDVQAVKKDSKNLAQKFNFRGIDAVMNAVGPALRKYGVVILPEEVDVHRTNGNTASGKQAAEVFVKVAYRIYGPAGDSIHGKVAAEAIDFGDKAIAKAMSVAYRTFLLQALTIPTDEPDPDSESYDREAPNGKGASQQTSGPRRNTHLPMEQGVPKRTATEQCRTILDGFCATHQLDGDKVREEYFAAGGEANPDMLRAWLAQNYGAGKVQ